MKRDRFSGLSRGSKKGNAGGKSPSNGPEWRKQLGLLLLLVLAGLLLFQVFQGGGQSTNTSLAFSDFLERVNQHQVQEVLIRGNTISGRLTDGQTFSTYAPMDASLVPELKAADIKISAAPPDDSSWLHMLLSWLPMLLLIGIWVMGLRQMQGGAGRALGFGRSRAKMLVPKEGRITFQDVAGVEEAKVEVQEIVEFLKDPKKFQRLGGRIPKGVLLMGPPGTGKTLLARAIAGEAEVPFFTISGSDFVEMFVGVGASRVRDMFEQAKKNAPCLIFIDEIDAVGRHRGVGGMVGANDEREQTLNQLLVEMDGFDDSQGVILIAATNRPDVLDPALLRPGRFDRQVVVPIPDVGGREQILKVHMKKIPLAIDVDVQTLARGTPGFSGADLANLVNEAALLAARKNRSNISMAELEEAKDKVMMGAERRSLVMGDEEKKLTAYHEAGHALVGLALPASDPIHKATIIPRGRALGMVMRLPERDRLSVTRAKLEADLAVAMGGRVAEEIIFGHDSVTTGASSDIKMATDLARRMVMEWGMSPELGPLNYVDTQEGYLGRGGTTNMVSDSTTQAIDRQVRVIVERGYSRAQEILTQQILSLHVLAKGLLDYETLTGDEIQTLLSEGKIERPIFIAGSNRRSSVPSSAPSSPANPEGSPAKTRKPRARTPSAPPAVSPETPPAV